MKRAAWTLLAAALLAGTGLVLARHFLLRRVAERAVAAATGFKLEIGGLHVGLTRPVVEITAARLDNPAAFPVREALRLDRIRVVYEPASLFRRELHLREVELSVPSASVVILADGESNIARLGRAGRPPPKPNPDTPEPNPDTPGPGQGGAPAAPEPDQAPAARAEAEREPRTVRIDRLTLVLGQISVRRYDETGRYQENAPYDVNIRRTYGNVTDLRQLGALLGTEIMAHVGPRLLMDLQQVLQENEGDLKATAEDLKKTFKGLLDQFNK